MSEYRVGAGRTIVRNGVEMFFLKGIGTYSPTELDRMAHRIAKCLSVMPVIEKQAADALDDSVNVWEGE